MLKNLHYLHNAASPVSCVKPNASQQKASLRDDVRFPTVYCRIKQCKFLIIAPGKWNVFLIFPNNHMLLLLIRSASALSVLLIEKNVPYLELC